jgi:PEP-CTERM motif-containing protein
MRFISKRDTQMSINHVVRAVLLLLLSLSLLATAKADTLTINLTSAGTAADPGQYNSMGNTVVIADPGSWTTLPGSSWVSFADTGDPSAAGFVPVANGTVVSFFDVFNVTGAPTGGSITVLADDTASVILNGVTLMAMAPMTGNTYAFCSDFDITCLVPTTINLPASVLQTGSNTLEFDVAQEAGGGFGLDYSGSVSSFIDPYDEAVATPEPPSVILLGVGLLALAAFALRRKRATVIE